MAIAKIQTGIRLLPDVYKKLQYLAERENRSLNKYVELLLVRHIEEYEREHGPIPIADNNKD